jgi:hypothetical protein
MATMQPGLHVVERARLAPLAALGVDVPEPFMGILDVLRMSEGHLPEPPAGRPLGVVGLDAMLAATPGDPTRLLQAMRAGLVEARRYFAWKAIPVVMLVDGEVDNPADDTGLHLRLGARRCALAPLLGTRLSTARADARGWWWASQIG